MSLLRPARLFAAVLAAAGAASCDGPEPRNIDRTPPATAGPTAPPPGPAPEGMVWIPGGEFRMGSAERPDEQPVHRVVIEGFWMDETEVTNAQFAAFVAATGYVTAAEKTPRREDFPPELRDRIADDMLRPGANNFRQTPGPVPLDNELAWWEYRHGAGWRHPNGPGSSIDGRDSDPVVCVNWDDAAAFADWAGKRLPTEAEWEFAARGGADRDRTPRENEADADGVWRMNTWQGDFPASDTAADGFHGLAPVRSFPPNAFGLHDMAGNVWEWCADWYAPDYYLVGPVYNPRGPGPSPNNRHGLPARVMRGGSWLCNDCYCTGYRPSARQSSTPDTASNHLGFRCARSAPPVAGVYDPR